MILFACVRVFKDLLSLGGGHSVQGGILDVSA